jgi:hypothetical protein
VRFACGSGETKNLFVPAADRRVDGKLELDRSIKLRVEFDLANISMRSSLHLAKGRDHGFPRRTAVGAENLPSEIQEAAAGRVEE